MIALRMLRGVVLLLFVITFACSSVSLRGLAQHVGGGSIGSGTSDGSCSNVDQSFPDNPFFGWPISGGSWPYVTAFYCDPAYMINLGSVHWGIDFGYPLGTPVLATASGTIVRAEFNHALRGNNIKLCAINGWCATYMHLSGIEVFYGDVVWNGQQIGFVGSTGNSTGHHLHYEIRDPADTAVDPAPTLP